MRKKQRCVGLLLCVMLLLSLLSVQAMAASSAELTDAAVASVTTADGATLYYDSYSDAAKAATDAKTATLTVLKDASHNAYLYLTDASYDITLEIPSGVTLTITTSYGIWSNGGKLTLRGGGTLLCTGGAAVYCKGGTLDVSDCTLQSTASGSSGYGLWVNGATVAIHSGTFVGADAGYGFYTNGGDSSKINIAGGAFRGGAGALSVSAQATSGTRYLADLIDTSVVAFHHQSGWTSGESLTALEASYGETTVEPLPMTLSVSGSMAAVVNAGVSTTLAVHTTVTGSLSDVSYQWYQRSGSAGDYTAVEGATAASYETPTTLTAGTTYEYYCQAQFQGYQTQSDTFKVTVASGSGNLAWYSVNDGSAQFITSARNFAALFTSSSFASSKVEIHLMQNMALTSAITVSKGNYFIYGESYTLSSTSYVFTVKGGSLTLVNGSYSSSANLISVMGGQLTIAGGSYHSTKATNNYAVYLCKDSSTSTTGTVTMTGGTILCDMPKSVGIYCYGGTMKLQGGTIRCTEYNGVGIQVSATSGVTSEAIISGGAIEATGSGAMAINVAEGGKLSVTGGSFSSAGTVMKVYTGSVRLSGGHFSGTVSCTNLSGKLNNILSAGSAFYVLEGDAPGWVTEPASLSSLSGVAEVRPIPVELISYTETVDLLVNGYSVAPQLTVNAQARSAGSTVTYQWYSRSTNSAGEISAEEPIPGATSGSYQVPMGLHDTRIYYVCAMTCEGYSIRTADIVVTVAPASYVHEAPAGLTALYGMTLADLALENPAGNSEGVWTWKNPALSVGLVGTRTFAAVFTPELAWLYEPVEVQVTVTVEKTSPVLVIDPDYQSSQPLDKEYNGKAVADPDPYYFSLASGTTDAKLTFRWYDAADTLLSEAPTNAGSYTVEAYYPETYNANEAKASMPVVIRPKLIEPTVILSTDGKSSCTAYSHSYDRTEHKPPVALYDGAVKDENKLPTGEYTVAYSNNINAGTATVTLTDNEGGNYTFATVQESFEIKKATLTVSGAVPKETSKVYDGDAAVEIATVYVQGRKYQNGIADDVSVVTRFPSAEDPAVETCLLGYVTYDGVHPDVASYSRVLFKDTLTLQGSAKDNYILEQPVGMVTLIPSSGNGTTSVEITQRELRENEKVSLSADDALHYVTNVYEHTYQWTMTELFPKVDLPMIWESPSYSWQANLSSDFYQGKASGSATWDSTATSETDIYFKDDFLFLPIKWKDNVQPMIGANGPNDEMDIGTITVTFEPKNYQSFSYELTIKANTKVNVVIIDWTPLSELPTYDPNQTVLGFQYAENHTALSVHRVDGKEIDAEELAKVEFDVFYTGVGDTVYPKTTAQPRNAGSYRVTASVKKNVSNFIGIDTQDFQILKAAPTYTKAPAAKTGLVYTGMTVPLIEAGTTDCGKVVYSLDAGENKNYSTAIPFGVAAGEYTVYYKILGDQNHSDTASDEIGSLTVTIDKAPATCTAPRAISGLKYDGSEVALVVAGRTSCGTMMYSLDGVSFDAAVPKVSTVGTYKVYYKVVGDENHYDSGEGDDNYVLPYVTANLGIVTLTVREIHPNYANHTRTYDGTSKLNVTILFYENVAGDDLGVQCDAELVLEDGQLPNVGSYDRVNISNLRLTGAAKDNYKLQVTELSNVQMKYPLEITKAIVSNVEVEKHILIYSPAMYAWDLTELYPAEIPQSLWAVNQPTYVMNQTDDGEEPWVISFSEPYYEGGAEVQDGKFYLPISEQDRDPAYIGGVTFVQVFENYKTADSDNVLGTFRVISSLKPSVEITGVASAGSVPYTGNGVLGYTGTPTSTYTGRYDVYYDGADGTTYPTSTEQPTDVGSYTVTIRIPSTVDTMAGAVSLRFDIVKSAPIVTGLGDNTVYYTGEPQPLVSEGSVTGGATIQYALEVEGEELVFSTDIPTATELGDYTVWYRVPESANHTAMAPVSLTVTIRNRSVIVSDGSAESGAAVSTTVSAKILDDQVTATVTEAASQNATAQAEKADSDSVVFQVNLLGIETPNSLQVVVEEAALTQLDAADVTVTVATPLADVTFSPESVAQLAAADADLEITVTNENGAVSVTLTADGEAVTELPGGMVVQLPCADTLGVVPVLVDAEGNETVLRKSATGDDYIAMTLESGETVKLVENARQFVDVPEDHWAESAVYFVSSHLLMNGTGEETFSPDDFVTRGMLAQMLYNLESEPESGDVQFADVAADAWYADAVAWAADEGIVLGYSSTQFAPETSISREQLAAMLYRYMGSPDVGDDVTLDFSDADSVSAYAAPAMRWAVSVGLFTGRSNNILAPGDTATRAEAAIVMQRLCKYMLGVQ